MSAEVESMFYTGEPPWHKLGTPVKEALSAADAIHAAGLDWSVDSQRAYTQEGMPIEGWRVNRRTSDGAVLGVVSERYKIVQNAEAFSFVDSLLDMDARFETAGSLRGGKRVWVMARLPEEYKVLGDPVTTYLTFTNGHDGSHAVQSVVSPVRVVCQNTLNYALASAARSWSMVHSMNIHSRMDEARHQLGIVSQYMQALEKDAEQLVAIPLTAKDWIEVTELLMPPVEREPVRVTTTRKMIETAMYRPDAREWSGTGWGAMQAAAWVTTHTEAPRAKPDRNMERFLDGEPLLGRLRTILLTPDAPADMPNDEEDAE